MANVSSVQKLSADGGQRVAEGDGDLRERAVIAVDPCVSGRIVVGMPKRIFG